MIPSAGRLLTGLSAVLLLLLALEWLLPTPRPPAFRAPPRLRATARSVTAPARDTGDWAEAILARPVFSISRRPPRAVVGVGGQATAGQARLAGIMITRTGRRAIFAPEGSPHQLVLAEGASVNQTTIRSILPDRIILGSGMVLRPSYDRNRPTLTTQPFQSGFANQGLVNAGFPQQGMNPPPGFPQPGFPQPGFQPPGLPQPGNGEDGGPPPFQPPGFRGNLIPPRRE